MSTEDLGQFYDDHFYDRQMTESLQAARIYLAHLWRTLQPTSALDVGCGRGTWLKACRELGSKTLIGLDGHWNRQELMVESSIAFKGIDLNRRFSAGKVELAMSLEVAEHLEPDAAPGFVESLTQASDAVLFGAAYYDQGGTNHINEQPQSYWADVFDRYGYVPFDLFRPVFWGDARVPFWYRQNTFLYVRRNSHVHKVLLDAGHVEVNRQFMNCVHPDLYSMKVAAARSIEQGFAAHIRDLLPSLVRGLKRRVGGARGGTHAAPRPPQSDGARPG